MSRDWRLYLEDMLEACRRIEQYSAGLGRDDLVANAMAYDAVLHNLEILGEAAKRVPNEVRSQMPDIEWAKIAGMRDWLAHAYFRVNADIVWDVIQNKVSPLSANLRTFLDSPPQ